MQRFGAKAIRLITDFSRDSHAQCVKLPPEIVCHIADFLGFSAKTLVASSLL
jgi:hypothetical protein